MSATPIEEVAKVTPTPEKEPSEHEGKLVDIKRYVLKASEFYKKNIVLLNNEDAENFTQLSDILHKLSLMKRVNEIYDNSIHVVTTPENKHEYKKMLLENPYLYFTNFDVKYTLEPSKVQELCKNVKRTIYIFDYDSFLEVEDYEQFIEKNVHIFILASKYPKYIRDVCDVLGPNTLLLHNKDKLKSMQKVFFKHVVQRMADAIDYTFDEFYQATNNENFDGRCFILKGGELRYN
jgi:hypothetical protein